MNNRFRVLLVLVSCCGFTFAADDVIQSRWADSDPRLDTNPISSVLARVGTHLHGVGCSRQT